MPIAFACTCGKGFQVKDEFAGKRTKCPACGAALTVPTAQALEPPPSTSQKAGTDEDEAYQLLSEGPEPAPSASAQWNRPTEPVFSAPARPAPPPPPVPPPAPRKVRTTRAVDRTRSRRPAIAISPGILGGLGAMLFAVIWFVLGLSVNRIYFYPPIMFVFGLVAVVRGLLGYSED